MPPKPPPPSAVAPPPPHSSAAAPPPPLHSSAAAPPQPPPYSTVAPKPPPSAGARPPPPPAVYTMASLYVGDLHPDTTEIDVADAFFAVAPFASVKLCRDRFTQKSLCYAYVNYFSRSDAAWAMSCLNHTDLRGKRMRIMWCQKDPTMRKTGVNNLFVKNLHPSITSASLHGLFSQFGAILSCKVAEENGKSKGFGFVQFATDLSALSALNALHGTFIEGKKLYVSKFVKKGDRMRNSEPEVFTNLCVKNLDDGVTEDQLKRMFSAHGKVCTATIMKDNAGKPRGYGFVKFASHEEAKMAIEALNGSQIGSKILRVERDLIAERKEVLETANTFTCKYQPPKSSKLYVCNLDASIDARGLELIFHAYGKITSAKIIFDQNGFSRGFGFVCFSSIEEARKAINSVNGTNVHGRSLIVDFARHQNERSRQSPTVQGHYTSNWDFFNKSYHAPADSVAGHYHMLPAPTLSVPYLRPPQQVGLPVQKVYPFGVHKQYGNHVSPVWLRSPKQRVKQESAFQPNLVKSEYLPMNEHNSLPQMETKIYHRWEIKKIHDSPRASFDGSKANKPFAASSTDLFKIYSDKRIQPCKENIQVGHENITGMVMEAGKPENQNWKHSQVFRVKVEEEF